MVQTSSVVEVALIVNRWRMEALPYLPQGSKARHLSTLMAPFPVCGGGCLRQVVWKSHWGEKVGVVVQRGGKPCVVEYSEMDTQTCQQTDASGKLVFGAGNICNHFFTLSFIRDRVLPNLHGFYHAAKKKIPHVEFPSTNVIKPTKENGYKLEAFIFDPFPFSENMALLEVAREGQSALLAHQKPASLRTCSLPFPAT